MKLTLSTAFLTLSFNLVLGALSFSTREAQATINIQTITGVSNSRFRTTQDDPTTVVVPTIYGGTGGSTAGCPSPNELCDSCASITPPAYQVCNQKRIQPGVELRIEFTSDSIPSGQRGTPALLRSGTDNTEIKIENTTVSSGDLGVLTVPWSTICNQLPTEGLRSPTCATSFTQRARLGFLREGEVSAFHDSVEITFIVHAPSDNFAPLCDAAENSSSICDFAVFPGDEKIFITAVDRGSLFPNAPTARVEFVRILYSTENFNIPLDQSVPIKVETGDQEGQNFLADRTLGGLTNGTRYYFRMATQDVAGNIFNFTPDSLFGPGSLCPDPSNPACPYAATPDEVFGLLTDDINCFITTAAFGSSFHPKVESFRQFRDLFLKGHPLGDKFIRSYYQWGPWAAQWLHDHSSFKAPVRMGLWPLWLGSQALLTSHQLMAKWISPLVVTWLLIVALPLGLMGLLIGGLWRLRTRLSPRAGASLLTTALGWTLLSFSVLGSSSLWSPLALADSPAQTDPRESQWIRHPDAEKGLMRITREGVYEYRVEPSEQTRSAAFRFGFFEPTQLSNPATGTFYEEIYEDTQAPTLIFDYDWRQWKSPLGRVSLSLGSGLFFSKGKGRFVTPPQSQALEEFTFLAMPHNASIFYRLQFLDRQLLVPYASAGMNLITFAEFREDETLPKVGGALAAHIALGASLSLAWIDRRSMQNMDRDYGINDIKLTFEFRQILGLNEDFDFTGELFSGGIAADF